MENKEYQEVINSQEFLESYPILLEEFGKDFIGAISMLLGYEKSLENNLVLRQSANTIRKIILNCTQDTVDIAKLNNPYPKWFNESYVENLVRTAVSETAAATFDWVASAAVVIKDKNGNVIPDAYLDVSEKPESLMKTVYDKLGAHGIKFTVK